MRLGEESLIEPIIEGIEEHNETKASNSAIQSRQRTPEKKIDEEMREEESAI